MLIFCMQTAYITVFLSSSNGIFNDDCVGSNELFERSG